MARRSRISIPAPTPTLVEVQRIARILDDEGIQHHPLPGDEYLFRDRESRTRWSRLFVRDHEHRLQPGDLWAPNERQLLMILASHGIPVGLSGRISSDQHEAWVADDPSLLGTGSTRSEALIHLLDAWAERRMADRGAEAQRARARQASIFDVQTCHRLLHDDEWDF